MIVGVWLCLGRPCCRPHTESQTSTRPSKHDKRRLLSTEVGRGSRIHDRTVSMSSANVNSGPITNSTALTRTPAPPENSLASEAVNAYLANLPGTVEGSIYDTAMSRGSSSRSTSADNPSGIEGGRRGQVPSIHGFDSWAFDSSTLGQPAPDAPRQVGLILPISNISFLRNRLPGAVPAINPAVVNGRRFECAPSGVRVNPHGLRMWMQKK